MEPLGRLLEPLGRLLEPLGSVLERLGRLLEPLGSFLEASWDVLERRGSLLEAPREPKRGARRSDPPTTLQADPVGRIPLTWRDNPYPLTPGAGPHALVGLDFQDFQDWTFGLDF